VFVLLSAGAALGAYALSHANMTAHAFAGALAPMPALLLLLAFSLGAAFVLAASAVAALRSRRSAALAAAAARAHTSSERAMLPNCVRPHVLALHIATAVLALALRLFYISETWRLDDLIDLVRASLELAATVLAGSVLTSTADSTGGSDAGRGSDPDALRGDGGGGGVTVSLRSSVNGGDGASAYYDLYDKEYAAEAGVAFDAAAAERESDRQLEAARLANSRARREAG